MSNYFQSTVFGKLIEINYEPMDFEMQPYVVRINGKEVNRFNTMCKAEGYVQLNTKRNSFPNVPVVDSSKEKLEESHTQSETEQVFIYRYDREFIGYIKLNTYSGTWFNGDGNNYDDWTSAGQALIKVVRKDLQIA